MKWIAFTIFFIFCFFATVAQNTPNRVDIYNLTGDFNVFCTYKNVNGTIFSSNGMYLVTGNGVVMFDTPWDTTQCQPLIDSIKQKHGKDVVMCISTHSHDDRTAGLEYYSKKGIKTYTTSKTDSISADKNEKRAEILFKNDTVFTAGRYSFQTYFPGHGHSSDNIVIWFPEQKVLYGGCIIKSTGSNNLGNLADADVNEWPISIKKIQQKFKNPAFIIPGHGNWDSKEALTHTLELLEREQ